MEYVAGASGAALGYIHNNVKGAVAGYQLGRDIYRNPDRYNPATYVKKLTQNSGMPVKHIGFKRTRTSTGDTTLVGSGTKKVAGARRPQRRRANFEASNMKTKDIKITNKIPKLKKVKKMKISKKFKKAVKQALEGIKPRGVFEERHYGSIEMDHDASYRGCGYTGDPAIPRPLPRDFTMNKQGVWQWFQNAAWSGSNFTFTEFLDAAQVLFYNKIDRLTNISGVQISNYEFRHQDPRYLKGDWDLNGLLTTPFKIIDSSVTYNFRNNTQRAVTMNIHRMTPKSKIARRASYYIDGTINDQMPIDAWYDWYESTFSETQEYAVANDVGVPWKQNAPFIYPNNTIFNSQIRGYDIWFPGVTPRSSLIMNGRYKIGTTKVTLQPGQVYTYVSQGPKNVNFDAKQWAMRTNSATDPITKYDAQEYANKKPGFSEDILVTVLPDLLPKDKSNNEAVGYYGVNNYNSATTQDVMITVEAIKRFKIEMPETVAGVLGATTLLTLEPNKVPAKPIANNARAPRKYLAIFNYGQIPVDPANLPDRVDDDNPVQKTEAED